MVKSPPKKTPVKQKSRRGILARLGPTKRQESLTYDTPRTSCYGNGGTKGKSLNVSSTSRNFRKGAAKITRGRTLQTPSKKPARKRKLSVSTPSPIAPTKSKRMRSSRETEQMRRSAIAYLFLENFGNPPEAEWGSVIPAIMKKLDLSYTQRNVVTRVLKEIKTAEAEGKPYEPTHKKRKAGECLLCSYFL